MAKRDPSPVVRFEAAFALVARGVAVDFDEFARLLGKQPDTAQARYRITRWLENNASRATPALRPLLALADTSRIPPREMAVLNQRVAPARQAGFATFASLAAQGAEDATAPGQPLLAPEEDTAKPQPRTSLTVVYFHKPGCPECARAREMLDEWKRDFPLLEVVPYNIVEPTGTLLNQTLCDRFHVPANRHTVAPAVFVQGGFLVKDIAHRELGELLAKTMKLPQDDAWRAFDEATMAAADVQIERRYRAITLPMVLLGGLIDGLNPCAFATIIFFLSYLQIARRTPREMLLVGAAFIAAVFLAYLAAGLLLHEVLDWIYTRVGGVRVWLTYGFAGLALVAAGLSVRDALLARAGRLDEMTLQLPGLLKDRIKGVIRGGARARRFVIAAFLSGLVVSLLELACTGQVYAPIIYQIRQGELNAVNWLLLYNLAFILPLVVIFLLAYGGLRSEALIGFQRRHTFTVKLALAAVFLALAVFIVLGERLLPDARRTAAAAPPATARPGG
jgi:cytochrome c biogenesis protein CcdA